jgi:hypothetical protein
MVGVAHCACVGTGCGPKQGVEVTENTSSVEATPLAMRMFCESSARLSTECLTMSPFVTGTLPFFVLCANHKPLAIQRTETHLFDFRLS